MPHKRAKRSVREAEKKNRQTDLAPTPLASEPIPKGVARVLGAESVRAAYRQRQQEEQDKKTGKEHKVSLLPGESLREFNRRVEDAHRPVVRAAMKRREGKPGDRKRKRGQDEPEEKVEERPVKEFETYSSSAPKRLNEVAMAPPVLKKPKSMAQKVMLERERERAVEMYRALKKNRSE